MWRKDWDEVGMIGQGEEQQLCIKGTHDELKCA